MSKESLESEACFVMGKICLELIIYMSHSALHPTILRDINNEKSVKLSCLG